MLNLGQTNLISKHMNVSILGHEAHRADEAVLIIELSARLFPATTKKRKSALIS